MSNYIHPLQQQQTFNIQKKKHVQSNNSDFKKLLEQNQGLKVSKHAEKRLAERNITINESDWQHINEKVTEAKQKGVTDSVVITKDATLIVSNKNNTVVTALNNDEAQNKIFTNINGMILLNN